MICIQTVRRYIWHHSTGYSISTSPAPIIYFGLFSWRKRFYKPNLVWQVWWRRANKSLRDALLAAAGSPIRSWTMLWFDSSLPHSPLWSLCVCDPPCPSARKRKQRHGRSYPSVKKKKQGAARSLACNHWFSVIGWNYRTSLCKKNRLWFRPLLCCFTTPKKACILKVCADII